MDFGPVELGPDSGSIVGMPQLNFQVGLSCELFHHTLQRRFQLPCSYYAKLDCVRNNKKALHRKLTKKT